MRSRWPQSQPPSTVGNRSVDTRKRADRRHTQGRMKARKPPVGSIARSRLPACFPPPGFPLSVAGSTARPLCSELSRASAVWHPSRLSAAREMRYPDRSSIECRQPNASLHPAKRPSLECSDPMVVSRPFPPVSFGLWKDPYFDPAIAEAE